MPMQYPPHFRRAMVNRMLAGKSFSSLVLETSLPEQTLYRLNHQALVDKSLVDGVDSADSAQSQAVHKCIKAWEEEPQLVEDASELVDRQAVAPPKGVRSEATPQLNGY